MRCNIIPVGHLTDQHLLAERNELRMIPPLLAKKVKKSDFKLSIPKRYCLGTGHMNFWIDKMLYLENRYEKIVVECLRRRFNLNLNLILDTSIAKEVECYNDWEPSYDDYILIRKRIFERIMLKPHWYKYYGRTISLDWIETHYGNL